MPSQLKQKRDLQKLALVVCTVQVLKTTVERPDLSLQNPIITLCIDALVFSFGLYGSLVYSNVGSSIDRSAPLLTTSSLCSLTRPIYNLLPRLLVNKSRFV